MDSLPAKKAPRLPAAAAPASGDSPESPAGSHVEWCKQLIAATISTQLSTTTVPETVSKDYRIPQANIHRLRLHASIETTVRSCMRVMPELFPPTLVKHLLNTLPHFRW